MKKITLLFAFISLHSYAACVDLSGHYAVCRTERNILIEGTDMVVKTIYLPGHTLYEFDYLPDGYSEREKVLFPANRNPAKIDEYTVVTAACLGNLLQVRRTVTRENSATIVETSQYFKQGDDLVRISRGKIGELKYFDILTCR